MPTITYRGDRNLYIRDVNTVAELGELVVEICVAEGYDTTKRQEIEMDALRAFQQAVLPKHLQR